jgi:ABC-type transport system involved in multi-copper enzyme maturation permease subunit
MRAFLSEWLKLRRRGMYFGAGLMVFFGGGLATVLGVIEKAGSGPPQRARGPAGRLLTQAQLSAPDGLARLLARGSALLGVIALVLFAMSFASEYSQGTLRNLLVREPRRLRLLLGKTLAMGLFVAIAVVLAMGVGTAIAYWLAPGHGITTSAWSIDSLFSAMGRVILTTFAWGVLGMVLGIALRAPAPAIGVGVAYGFVLENLLSAAWSSGARWLPGQLLSGFASGGSTDLSIGRAATLLIVYMAAILMVGATLFLRRDVTT